MAGNIKYECTELTFKATVSGYLDSELAGQMTGEFNQALNERRTHFCFDFSGMEMINSTALSCLLDIVSEGLANERLQFFFIGISQSCRLGFYAVGLLRFAQELANISEFEALLPTAP